MIVVGLGSNLGSREAFLVAAELVLRSRPELDIRARSSLYQTPALRQPGAAPQPDYLNAALAVETVLHPRELLPVLHSVERSLGRVRRERWGPRTLDLDILYFSGGPVEEEDLRVPHEGLVSRAFALAPLLDVAPWLEEYRAPLRVLPAPESRAWARTPEDALDDMDRRAFSLTAELGAPRTVGRIEPFVGIPSGEGPGFVVLSNPDRGFVLRPEPPPAPRPDLSGARNLLGSPN